MGIPSSVSPFKHSFFKFFFCFGIICSSPDRHSFLAYSNHFFFLPERNQSQIKKTVHSLRNLLQRTKNHNPTRKYAVLCRCSLLPRRPRGRQPCPDLSRNHQEASW